MLAAVIITHRCPAVGVPAVHVHLLPHNRRACRPRQTPAVAVKIIASDRYTRLLDQAERDSECASDGCHVEGGAEVDPAQGLGQAEAALRQHLSACVWMPGHQIRMAAGCWLFRRSAFAS